MDENEVEVEVKVEEKNYQQVSGEWEHIQKLIPILKEMGYIDMHLYYESFKIWVLQWHDSKYDYMSWQLRDE